MPDFMNPERDRVISFHADPDGSAGFDVLHLVAPQEIDGLEAARWRKVFRSPSYPCRVRRGAAAIRLGGRGLARALVNLAPPDFPG